MSTPRTEVMIFTRHRVLGLNRTRNTSIFTCPSLLSSQAAPRKVIHTRQNAKTSNIHGIGLLKKYLMTTSAMVPIIKKIMSTPAIMAVALRMRSKIWSALVSNFIVFRIMSCNPVEGEILPPRDFLSLRTCCFTTNRISKEHWEGYLSQHKDSLRPRCHPHGREDALLPWTRKICVSAAPCEHITVPQETLLLYSSQDAGQKISLFVDPSRENAYHLVETHSPET